MSTVQVRLPKKLRPIFQGDADVRGAYGGRGSAKTRSFAKMTAVRAYMWGKAGREGIILGGRQYMNSLDDSSLDEIKHAIRSEPWLTPYFDIGEKYVRTIDGRISYRFAGLDRSIDSVKSKSRILLCWVDEAEPVTDPAWERLIPTLRDDESELWVNWNPEKRGSATDRRFRNVDDPLFKITEMNWRDNPWFPAKLNRERLRDKVRNPKRYDHIWEGAYDENSEARIFDNVTIGRVEVPEKAIPLFGLDFGYSTDPMALIKLYYLPVVERYERPVVFVAQEAYGHKIGNQQMAPFLDGVTQVRDFPIVADSSRPESIAYLNSKGFSVFPSKKGAGSVKNGITWLQGVDIVVDPDCVNFADEAKGYMWRTDPLGKPLPVPQDGDDHGIDAARYALQDVMESDPDDDDDDALFLRM